MPTNNKKLTSASNVWKEEFLPGLDNHDNLITMIESYPNIPPVASRAKLFPIVKASNDSPDGGKFELNTFIEI